MLQLGNGQQLDFSWCHGFPSDGDRHYIASQGDSSLARAVVRSGLVKISVASGPISNCWCDASVMDCYGCGRPD